MGRERTDPCHTRAGHAISRSRRLQLSMPEAGFWFATYREDELWIVHRDAQSLDASSQEPLILILDSLPAHKGKAVGTTSNRQTENWSCISYRVMRRN